MQALQIFMEKYEDFFEWKCPKAGVTTFVKLKAPLLKLGGGTALGFCDVIREQAQVLLLPASTFNFTDEYIRLGFGRENFQEGLKVFDDFLHMRGLTK